MNQSNLKDNIKCLWADPSRNQNLYIFIAIHGLNPEVAYGQDKWSRGEIILWS